jgi:hypothetical protein
MGRVRIETSRINDWISFHDEFTRAFGFPDFYGRNMDAWIDCMSYLDDPSAGMTKIHIHDGDAMAVEVPGMIAFKRRCPAQFEALVECTAFVNKRRVEAGEPPMLTLTFIE